MPEVTRGGGGGLLKKEKVIVKLPSHQGRIVSKHAREKF